MKLPKRHLWSPNNDVIGMLHCIKCKTTKNLWGVRYDGGIFCKYGETPDSKIRRSFEEWYVHNTGIDEAMSVREMIDQRYLSEPELTKSNREGMNIGDQYDPDYFYLKNTASIEETVKYLYSKDDKPTDDMADDKELSEILAKLKIGQKSALGAGMGRATTIIFVDGREEAKQALTSLIKELVIPARSGREYDLADPTGSPLGERVDNRRFKSGGTMDYIDGLNSGYNRAINEFEQNLLKALEEN